MKERLKNYVKSKIGSRKPGIAFSVVVRESEVVAFHSKLAGTSFHQEALKRCKEGERLWLVREPDNPHDMNAISVWSQSEELIGYIKRDVAAELAPLMDGGVWIEVKISNLTGGTEDKPTIGCNIYVEYDPERRRWREDDAGLRE